MRGVSTWCEPQVRDRSAPDEKRPRALALLALGADKHAEAREHSLYRLITVSESLQSLHVEVRRAEACLNAFVRNNEDMAALYLSHRRSEGVGRATEDHQEVGLRPSPATAALPCPERCPIAVGALRCAERMVRSHAPAELRSGRLTELSSGRLAICAPSWVGRWSSSSRTTLPS